IPANEPAVRYYTMGDVTDPKAPGNVWRTADRWPPPSQPLHLYFTADGGLDSQPPATTTNREYDYDPLRPLPSVVLDWIPGQGPGGGPMDHRRLENLAYVHLLTNPPLLAQPDVTQPLTLHLTSAIIAINPYFTTPLM